MSVDIKICGLRRTVDTEYINEFKEIKYIGFVFAESKRKISIEEAIKIKNNLRSDIKTVGVFADMDIDIINKISKEVNLDIIQLHSNENNNDCKKAIKKVWKSISIKDINSIKVADNFSCANGFVLDTYNKNLWGGSGISFSWEIAKNFSNKYFTVLAGGINSENIKDALKIVNPNVIDVSSSVETDGFKDYKKIRQLIGGLYNE